MVINTEGGQGGQDRGALSSSMAFVSDAFTNVFETQKVELHAYLPKDDLVGGSVPYIPGTEKEAVWNAAAQACATERVHFCYTVEGGKIWYLATPSASLASNPNSWCPLAAALPGNSEYWDKDTVYIYEQEGSVGAIRWDKDTSRIQVYLGPSRTILPLLQSLEMNFITINPTKAKPALWQNLALHREKMSRVLTKVMVIAALFAIFGSFFMWVGTYLFANMLQPQMKKAHDASIEAANLLMIEAVNAQQNSTDRHFARVIELLNQTGSYGGILTKYEVKDGDKVEWTALIPNAVAPNQMNATAVGSEGDRVKIKGAK